MAAGVMNRVFAFEVHGLRHPSSASNTAPLLLSTGELQGAVFTAAFPAHAVLPVILPADVSGYNWSSDPRRVVGSGGQCSVKILDNVGTWGTQLLRNAKTPYFDIESSRLEQGGTAITVTGKSGVEDAPTENQIYWIEGEAVQVTSAPALVSGGVGTYAMTISRACCGSRDALHRLDPIAYYPGDDGKEDRLFLDTRPNFDSYLFTGALYLFRIDQFGAVVDWIKRYVYLDEAPKPLAGRKWEFRFSDVGDLLSQHQMGSKDREITLSHRLQAEMQQQPMGSGNGGVAFDPNLYIPVRCTLWLTRMEAERFFREPLHQPGTTKMDETLVTALSTRLQASSEVLYFVEIEAAGKWLYKFSGGVSYTERVRVGDSTATPFVQVPLDLVDKEFNVGIYSTEEGADFAHGWSLDYALQVGYLGQDDTAPKVNLRMVLQTTPINALLYLCCSDGAASSDAYDKMIGRVGLGLPSTWFNLGAVAPNPLAIDIGAPELLIRNQLIDETFHYHFSLKKENKLAEFLSADICVLHSLLFGPLRSGLLTLRPWARASQSIGALATMPTLKGREIAPGAKLERVRALTISSGIQALTMEPVYTRSIRARDVKLRKDKDFGEVQGVRVWQPGRRIETQDITTGSFSLLVNSFLNLYGGAPIVYENPTSMDFLIDNGLEFADYVDWSNVDVLSHLGTGISGTFLLFGYSFSWRTGELTGRVIEDTFNGSYLQPVAGDGSMTAPALRPNRITPLGGLSYRVEVDVIANITANIASSAFGGFFRDLPGSGGVIRITRPAHNVLQVNEREGHLEAYATVDAVSYDAGRQRSVIDLTFDAAWERGSKQIMRDILIPGESLLSLSDRRPADTHPQGSITLEPLGSQLYANGGGINFTKVAGPQSFDKILHLFGA
jgi:hypothetical protein